MNLGNFQSTRLDMTVSGLDTNKPLDEQLAAATPYVDAAFNFLEQSVYQKLRDSGLVKAVVSA